MRLKVYPPGRVFIASVKASVIAAIEIICTSIYRKRHEFFDGPPKPGSGRGNLQVKLVFRKKDQVGGMKILSVQNFFKIRSSTVYIC